MSALRFREFVAKPGAAIRVGSKLDASSPWQLQIRARAGDSALDDQRVYGERRRPFTQELLIIIGIIVIVCLYMLPEVVGMYLTGKLGNWFKKRSRRERIIAVCGLSIVIIYYLLTRDYRGLFR